MLTYPQLVDAEQANLPKLLAMPTAIPSRFSDSTHHVWHCQTVEGEMVLKVCNPTTVTQSAFWLGLNHLFGADFPNSLGGIQHTHDFLQENGTLTVPAFVASKTKRFVLSRFLAGQDLDSAAINEQSIIALAKHIARLHQHTSSHWGCLHAPTFTTQDWAWRLEQTIRLLAEQSTTTLDKAWLNKMLAQASNIKETSFVPMMVDLRWDQLRICDDGALALIDLDAFVIAPNNLDLVLIANLLSCTQLQLFKQHYETVLPWPNDTQQQPCYQLLLFLMQVLGETDLASWMKRI
jgi:Ser/Thr protein kinase RdoA (MazF antagonist)